MSKIRINNVLGETIDVAQNATRNNYVPQDGDTCSSEYDKAVKRLLSNIPILTRILKFSMREFAGWNEEDVVACIVGEPVIEEKDIAPGHMDRRIRGESQESSEPGEGVRHYDIRISVKIPGKKDAVTVLIDVEAQRKYEPGHDIVPRGFFYAARMLSEQDGIEFTDSNYNDLKKVVSIWICMNCPDKSAHTITEYSVNPHQIFGHKDELLKKRYDMMSVVLICLGRTAEGEQENELISMLNLLLSNQDAKKIKDEMENKYHIKTSSEIEEELINMCNLSQECIEKGEKIGIEKGEKQGTVKVLKGLVMKGRMTHDEAVAESGLPQDEFDQIAATL